MVRSIKNSISSYSRKPVSYTHLQKASDRIVKYAFEYAKANDKKKVTAIHKANIMKLTDGLFLNCAKEIAKGYPDIQFNDKIIDAACMDLALNPYA